MKSIKDELAKVLKNKDEAVLVEAFQKFCRTHAGSLPLPGEDPAFDRAMWAASEHMSLSRADEQVVERVAGRLLASSGAAAAKKTAAASAVAAGVSESVLILKELLGAGKEAAIAAWQDMVAAMAWQQLVPAGALRGVGTQLVSLGTLQGRLDDVTVQVNIGYLVDRDQLRLLVQAKDAGQEGLADVELRVRECERGVVFSRKTNQDGSVVAPSVSIAPGKYQIEVAYRDEVASTPYFVV
jgi:hypothetical protein